MTNGVPEASPGGWTVPLVSEVTLISIGHALGLEIWVDAQIAVLVRIENSFTYQQGNDSELVEWQPRDLGRFASLFGAMVSRLDITDEGHLSIAFDDGRRITVAPHAQFESFQVNSSLNVVNGGWMFVGMPAGGLAVWVD